MKVLIVICAIIGVILSIRFIHSKLVEIPTISAEQIRNLQSSEAWTDRSVIVDAVSYTHLTLPTIYSV